MEPTVRDMLTNFRSYKAELHLLEADKADGSRLYSAEAEVRRSCLKHLVMRVEAWMLLLSDDERFVIEMHLMAGIDIPRIVALYQERWGNEFAKTEHTIKGYQKHALLKILAFEQHLHDLNKAVS